MVLHVLAAIEAMTHTGPPNKVSIQEGVHYSMCGVPACGLKL